MERQSRRCVLALFLGFLGSVVWADSPNVLILYMVISFTGSA